MPKATVICCSSLFRNFKSYGVLRQIPDKLYHGRPNAIADDSINHSVISNGIVTSPFPSITVPKMGMAEYVWRNTSPWDDKELISCAASGRSYTYGVAKQLIDQFAQALLSRCGLKPGDVVAMYLPNVPEYPILSHGILSAGLIQTSVNPLFKYEELLRQFQSAEVKAIVTVSVFLDNATKIALKLNGYKATLCLDSENDIINNVLSIPKLLTSGHKAELPTIKSKNLALLPFSSGTTGLPKGVKLTHYNLVANLAQGDHPDLTSLKEDERFKRALTVIPFFHIYGYNLLNACIIEGAPVITLPKFSPDEYIKALVEHQPYYLLVVPALLIFLASHPLVTKEHLNSVNYVFSGAASASDELVQKFREKAQRNIGFRQGYGLTETSPVVTMTPRSTPSSKKSTIGVLYPNTQAKVVDLTTSETLGPTQSGELWVKGPQVMEGYLNNEKATEEIFSKDGWLRTGDVGYYDEDGYFYIVDRCKDLIKVKGHQVSPTELETLILEIPGIVDVSVVGIPDEQTGELPRAFVVKNQNSRITEEDIHAYVNPKVAHYKKISGGIKFLNSIPRNPSGKVLKNELKNLQL